MSVPPPGGAGVPNLRLVLCRWDGRWYGLQAARVEGLSSGLGRAAPSLGDLLGLAPGDPAPGRILKVRTERGELGFTVAEPVIQAEVPAGAIRPLPPILAASLRLPWVRALALCPALGPAPIVVLDFDRPGVDPHGVDPHGVDPHGVDPPEDCGPGTAGPAAGARTRASR